VGEILWRDLDRAGIERDLLPASTVPSLQPYLDLYAHAGAAARAAVPHIRHRYGDHRDEWLWYAASAVARAPLFVFIHGGYWRRLSADDVCLLAEGAHAAGFAFAALNHTLVPHAPLATLVDQARRGVAWLFDRADELGHDPGRVHVGGHSSGAHLAGMVAVSDTRPAGWVMVSGVFDIEPVVHTQVNDDARLSLEDARALSPLRLLSRATGAPCVVILAQHDPAEFHRQAHEWTDRWSNLPGNPRAVDIVAGGRNHFDVLLDVVDPSSTAGQAVLAQLVAPGSGPRPGR
jgi:arylformamidase